MADIKNSVLPLYKKINDAQSDLFPLSLTAEFKVSLNLGFDNTTGSLSSWLTKCGVANSPQDLARYDFFASDVLYLVHHLTWQRVWEIDKEL